MDRKFLIVLAVTAGLLAACGGNSAPVTEVIASPTEAPTLVPTAEPTLVPTETREPTAVPTSEPTPVPTEVPMYVGLLPEEVEALRAECLQENPDSPCLPLPVNPGSDSAVEDESRGVGPILPDEQSVVIQLPPGTRILSPLAGQMRVYGYDTWRWYPLDGMDRRSYYVSFQWGPWRSEQQNLRGGYIPTFELSLGPEPPGEFLADDPGPLGEESLKILGGQRDVAVGEPIAEITGEKPMYLRISWYPTEFGEYGFFLSQMTSDFLLLDDFGSIVYVVSE